MTRIRLTQLAAALAIGAAAIVALPTASQATPLPSSPVVATSLADVSAGHALAAPTTATATNSAISPARRRFRIRSRNNSPASTGAVIFAVIVAVIVFGVLLFIRYGTYKTLRNRAINTPNYNGPTGPQYGVTGVGGYSPQYQQVPPTTPPSPQGYAGYGGPQGYTPGTGYGGQVPPGPTSGASYPG